MVGSRNAAQEVGRAFQDQDPVCARKLSALLDHSKEGLESELELCKQWKEFVKDFEESKKEYVLVVGGSEITSLEVLYESYVFRKNLSWTQTLLFMTVKERKFFETSFLTIVRVLVGEQPWASLWIKPQNTGMMLTWQISSNMHQKRTSEGQNQKLQNEETTTKHTCLSCLGFFRKLF